MGQHQHHILRINSVLLWSSIRQHFDGGILFLSDDIAASAAVSPGCKCLYELGAVCIHRLEDEPQKRVALSVVHPEHALRACIICSTQLQDVEKSVRSILQALPPRATVRVLTTSLGHASGVSVWGEDSSSLQDIAAQWSGFTDAAVSTGYFPLLVRPVGGPGFEINLDLVSRTAVAQDLRAATLNDTTRIRQLTDESEDSVKSVERLVHVLSWLRPCLGIKPSLFAAGPVAKCVAETMNELHAWPQALPGSSLRPAALVLVDRASDLPGILKAPHSSIGVVGRPMCTEAGAMGSSAATWWRAAVSPDQDSHIHASKVLQKALSGLSASKTAEVTDSELSAIQRSGSSESVSLLAASAAAECSRIEKEAAAARDDESTASRLLMYIPEDAMSIAKSVTNILGRDEGSSDPGSTILMAVRALLIGCVTMRTSLGAGAVVNMDPLDSFLSLYGPDIQRSFARAVDQQLAKHGGSVQELVNMLHEATTAQTCGDDLRSTPPAANTAFPAAQLPVACAVGESSECTHSREQACMQRCESMSLHLSDACTLSPPGSPLGEQPPSAWPLSVACSGLLRSDGMQPVPGGSRAGAVAESSDWGDDWGQAWDADDAQAQVSAANADADAGWGESGWDDDGDWIDATAVAPVGPAAVTSPATTVAANLQALAPAPAPAPVINKPPKPTTPKAPVTVSAEPTRPVPAAPRSTSSTDGGKEKTPAKKKKKIMLKKVTPKSQENSSAAQSTAPTAGTGSSDAQQVAMESTTDSKSSDFGKCGAGDTELEKPPHLPPAVDAPEAVGPNIPGIETAPPDAAGNFEAGNLPIVQSDAALVAEAPAPRGDAEHHSMDVGVEHSVDVGAEQQQVSDWGTFDHFEELGATPVEESASVVEPAAPVKEIAVADSPQMQDQGAVMEESWGDDAWGADDWVADESTAEPSGAFTQAAQAESPVQHQQQATEVHGYSFNASSADAPQTQPGHSGADVSDNTEGRVGLDWADRVAGSSGGPAWGASWLTKGLETLASQVEAVVMAPPSESDVPKDDLHEDGVHHPSEEVATLGDRNTSSFDEQWSGWQSHITDHHSKLSLMLGRELGSTTSIPGLYTEDATEDSLMVAAQIPEDRASSANSLKETEPDTTGAEAAEEEHASEEQPIYSGTGEDEALHQELTFAEHAIQAHVKQLSVGPKGSDGSAPLSETLDLSPQGHQTAPGPFGNLVQDADTNAEWGDWDAAADDAHADAAPLASAEMEAWGHSDQATPATADNDKGWWGAPAATGAADVWGQDEGWGDQATLENVDNDQGSWGAPAATGATDAWRQDDGWGEQATLDNADNDQGSWGAWEDDSWNAAQPQSATVPATPSPPAAVEQQASPEASAFAHSLLRAVCRAARAANGCESLLETITNAVLSGGKEAAVPGVVSVRSTMSNMLSHGLGALGLAGADRPLTDFSCVVVVVLGGLSMEEVAVVESTVQKHARPASALAQDKPDVLVGGTSIIHADEVASMLLQA